MAAILYIFSFSLSFLGNFLLEGVDGKSILVERATADVISPLTDISQKLNDALKDIELKKLEVNDQNRDVLKRLSQSSAECRNQESIKKHAALLESWSFDSCVDLTDDCKLASDIAWEGGRLAYNLTSSATSLVGNILDCPTWNVSDTAQCYHGHIEGLKELVVAFKNVSVPVFSAGVSALKQIRVDFDLCVGIPITANRAIEQHLKNC